VVALAAAFSNSILRHCMLLVQVIMHSYCGASFINAMHEMCASNKSHGQLLWKVLSKTKFVTWKSIKQMADLLFSLDLFNLHGLGQT